jgi:hypothetical protein
MSYNYLAHVKNFLKFQSILDWKVEKQEDE